MNLLLVLNGEPILDVRAKNCIHPHGNASGVTGLANASIKGQWEFGIKRGALLIMSQPHSSYIPPKVLLKQLVDIPVLRNKSLVTEVISCPAYSLDRKSTRLNSSHVSQSRMPSSA